MARQGHEESQKDHIHDLQCRLDYLDHLNQQLFEDGEKIEERYQNGQLVCIFLDCDLHGPDLLTDRSGEEIRAEPQG